MTFTSFILLLVMFPRAVVWAVDYCDNALSCNGVTNSGCDCDFGPNCQKPRDLELADDMRKIIADTHNKYREKIASGSENRGGINSGATDMFMLEYDRDLEHTADCWNKKCTFTHDKCRSTPDFQPAGQNLYYSAGKKCEWRESFKEAMYLWYEEVRDMTNDCIRAYASGCATAKVGHFTQLAWAKTTHVGCSLIEHASNTCQMICNYGPAGNYQTEQVFVQGDPASDCDFKSSTYKHLCARNEEQAKNRILQETEDMEEKNEEDHLEKSVEKRTETGISSRLVISRFLSIASMLYSVLM